jgi:hypothetical protein
MIRLRTISATPTLITRPGRLKMGLHSVCAVILFAGFATDPGAPLNQGETFTVNLADDSVTNERNRTGGGIEYPAFDFPVVEGDLVLLESGDPATEMAAYKNGGVTHPELWSDVILFANVNGKGTALLFSDPTNEDAATFVKFFALAHNFLFIKEGFGPETSSGGLYTDYLAGASVADGGKGVNTYHIESVVPEPTGFTLLGLGSLSMLGYARRCRRRAVAGAGASP